MLTVVRMNVTTGNGRALAGHWPRCAGTGTRIVMDAGVATCPTCGRNNVAIRRGKLAGAAIDVLPFEPPPADHPLLVAWRDVKDPCHDRVILNPHSAFYSEEGLLDMRVKGSQACRRALLGEPLRNIVN